MVKEILYKGNIIYSVDDRLFCIGKRGLSYTECSRSLEAAKEEMDLQLKLKTANEEFRIRQEREAKEEEQKRLDREVKNKLNQAEYDFAIIKKVLDRSMDLGSNTIIQVYYFNKEQKRIAIKHLSGKKFLYKDSRKKPVELYYSEVAAKLFHIRQNYQTGKWVI